MSEINPKENFWTKLESDGGFNLGELVVLTAGSGVGKTMLSHPESTKVRDYNGPQLELDFDDTNLNHVE